ncbi:hypothetical protein SELMODRAFT_415252 [Selaginella moellendorffii]|uniref:Uncharacterized protein n=1 Tax=Selaginella moellendorffii TaxID=88036 RepID=D8RVI2_SELML|nr:hypothetical protein SELMODRAFT_415252 [Selaginella moellendorffii]
MPGSRSLSIETATAACIANSGLNGSRRAPEASKSWTIVVGILRELINFNYSRAEQFWFIEQSTTQARTVSSCQDDHSALARFTITSNPEGGERAASEKLALGINTYEPKTYSSIGSGDILISTIFLLKLSWKQELSIMCNNFQLFLCIKFENMNSGWRSKPTM